jgi:alpha-tubulin suppressor-like RCC1 family protein
VSRVAAGLGHTCAVGSNGEVWCWGGGFTGQLGTGVAPRTTAGVVRVPTAQERR